MLSVALVLAAILAHELGHLFAARALGWGGSLGLAGRWLPYPVARVWIPASGSTRQQAAVALAGPLASVVFGLAVLAWCPLAGWVSILLGVLSLAPIPKWDGAHIWRAVRS